MNRDVSRTSGVKKSPIRRFFRRVTLFAVLAVILFAVFYYFYASWTYSEGTRTGYLVKISEKGYIFKTFEGELNLGGFQDGEVTGVIGNIWAFSIPDEELYKKMQDFEGEKVTLSYTEINKAMFWQGDTNYFVSDIRRK